MTPEQAANCVAVLNAAFPREALEPATVRLYIDEIALLNDAAVGIEAARLIARNGERFPTLRDFRSTYRGIAESHRSNVRALPEPKASEIPEWVQVWFWARHSKGDDREFPQQDEHGFGSSMSLSEYEALVTEWRSAGSPRISGVRALWEKAA